MKILYELDLQDDQKFNADDFPPQIEILRAGKKPFIIKPVAIQTQDIYNRLNEAEALLKRAVKADSVSINYDINEYFNRHVQ